MKSEEFDKLCCGVICLSVVWSCSLVYFLVGFQKSDKVALLISGPTLRHADFGDFAIENIT